MFNNPNALYPQLNQALGQLQSFNQFGQPQMPQKVIEVSGRAGAEAYPLGAESSALMLDTTAPILWVAKTDSGGYKTLTAFDIKEHDEQKQEDVIKSLEDRIKKIEERLNGKSNNQDVKQQRRTEQ